MEKVKYTHRLEDTHWMCPKAQKEGRLVCCVESMHDCEGVVKLKNENANPA